MNRFILILCLFISPQLVSLSAQAHSPLLSSSPADGEQVSPAPASLKMEFKSAARLVKLALMQDSTSTSIDLDGTFAMQESLEHSIPLPVLDAGAYKVKWRAMGEDGHVIKGEFGFTISE
jgi:methionine-rich copper-binding protein CopC